MSIGKSDLTDHQREAYDKLLKEHRILDNTNRPQAKLTGEAGTGKSFLIQAIANAAVSKGRKVIMTAPTHQAKGVLKSMAGDLDNTGVMTTHSLLGLTMKGDGKGGYKVVRDKYENIKVPPSGAIIFVDESSMIGHELWDYIQESREETLNSWVFVGDMGQLPPVSSADEDIEMSPALELPGPTLSELYRQKEGSILGSVITRIRHQEQWRPFTGLREDEDGEKFGAKTTSSEDLFARTAQARFDVTDKRPDWRHNPFSAQILAYTNKRVINWADRMLSSIHGYETMYPVGEWLTLHDTYAPGQQTRAYNSERVQIKEVNRIEGRVLVEGFTCDVLHIKARRHNYPGDADLIVVPDDEQGRFDRELKRRKERALAGKAHWGNYYRLKEAVADVRYAYSSTVHKSQGSTIETVFLDLRNLKIAQSEFRELLYTGVSRASKRLLILE